MLLADIVERNTRTRPDGPAVRFGDTAGARTWRQLHARSARLANAIRPLAGPG